MIIWGPKTIALFDVWSIEHFVSGMNLYFLTLLLHRRFAPKGECTTLSVFGWIMAICFAWEALEHYLEIGFVGETVAAWFQGVEFSLNRLITDPALIFIGAWVAMKRPRIELFAKVFSFIWLALHVFVFPDSMYLQRLLPVIGL